MYSQTYKILLCMCFDFLINDTNFISIFKMMSHFYSCVRFFTSDLILGDSSFFFESQFPVGKIFWLLTFSVFVLKFLFIFTLFNSKLASLCGNWLMMNFEFHFFFFLFASHLGRLIRKVRCYLF